MTKTKTTVTKTTKTTNVEPRPKPEFKRFESLTKKLLAVPKKEADEQREPKP